jgi:hypothetical protein
VGVIGVIADDRKQIFVEYKIFLVMLPHGSHTGHTGVVLQEEIAEKHFSGNRS